MTILLINIVPEGILFGADSLVTTTNTITGAVVRQRSEAKIAKLEKRNMLIGYAGAAKLNGDDTLQALLSIIDGVKDNATVSEVSHRIFNELQTQAIQEFPDKPMQTEILDQHGLLVHLAGFVKSKHGPIPQIWFVRNFWSMTQKGAYFHCRIGYQNSEEFSSKLLKSGWTESYFRENIKHYTSQFEIPGFRQGVSLDLFNRVNKNLLSDYKSKTGFNTPTNLDGWSQITRASVAAFIEEFKWLEHPPVGGEIAVEFIAWH